MAYCNDHVQKGYVPYALIPWSLPDPTCAGKPSLLFLVLCSIIISEAVAVNFNQCLAEIHDGKWGTVGGTDNQGNPVSDISNTTAITYDLCIRACGLAAEPFSWTIFSQQFSAWLLPWLALVSQLPFGAIRKYDNFVGVLLTIGSPTLAAYSLALTILNGKWVYQQFAVHRYPNANHAARILSSLQQAPLKVASEGGLLAALIVLPQNDDWWEELTERLDYTHTWSIAAAASIAWVVIAYIFTVVVSFTNVEGDINVNGQGVGSVWLWLLPIVVGWLQLSPKCDAVRLKEAMTRANIIAHTVDDTGTVCAIDVNAEHAFSLEYNTNTLFCDHQCSEPVYNYARFFSWVQCVEEVSSAFHYASAHLSSSQPVANQQWRKSSKSGDLDPDNRIGTIGQLEIYCQSPPNMQITRSRWGSHIITRCFVAAALALFLQWGTTGAAVVVVWFTPTVGM